MMKFGTFGLLTAMFSSAALAQAPSADTCVKLANTIAAGYSVSFSDRQFEALRYYARCEANQSASSTGVNVGYAAFSLGVKLDEASAKAYCGKAYSDYNIRTTDYNHVKIVFNQALGTIDKCLEAARKGWDIKYEQVSDDSVTLNISHGGTSGGRILGIDVIPPTTTGLQCNPALPSEPLTITATTPYATTCSRSPTTHLIDGIQHTSATDVVLNLRLADGPFAVRLAGYSSSILKRIDQKIESMRAEILGNLKVSLVDRGADREYKQGDFWTATPTNVLNYTCPPKNVLVGMEFDMLGLSGVRTPTRVKYICRELAP